jgi:Iron-containing redox enzyme
MKLPPSRGRLSSWLVTTLTGADPAAQCHGPVPPMPGPVPDMPAWHDDDLQLALWCCYELHYRGFDDVDERWEWNPAVIGFRGTLERRWLASLRGFASLGAVPSAAVADTLTGLARRTGGPDLSGYLAREADKGQFTEYVAHRSVYQLKEADPHSFGIPRLTGAVKAALVEIQADEYGGGMPERMHSELFRTTMRWAGLEDEYGLYVPAAPAVTLAVSNLMSVFALNRRWLGALLGHLAALEMTSTSPNKRYSAGARRLGADEAARRYFDEHVAADAVHEQIAAHDLCGGYAAQRPGASADILFGASCCLALDDELARYLLSCWRAGRPSLLLPSVARAPGACPRARNPVRA